MSDAENPRMSQVSQAPRMNSVERPVVETSKPSVPYTSAESRGAPYGSSSRGPPPTVDPQTASNRFAVTVIGIIVIICLLVAAIVLPLTLDSYCNCPDVPNISGPTSPLATPSPILAPTPSPTVSPGTPTTSPTIPTGTTEVSDRFFQFVQNYASVISGEEVFEDPGSPQFRAAQFIADEAEFNSDLTSVAQLDDLYALTVFYYSTNGDDWTECSQGSDVCDEESWLNPQLSQCNWNWIDCNDEGRVVDIIFSKCFVRNVSFKLWSEFV